MTRDARALLAPSSPFSPRRAREASLRRFRQAQIRLEPRRWVIPAGSPAPDPRRWTHLTRQYD